MSTTRLNVSWIFPVWPVWRLFELVGFKVRILSVTVTSSLVTMQHKRMRMGRILGTYLISRSRPSLDLTPVTGLGDFKEASKHPMSINIQHSDSLSLLPFLCPFSPGSHNGKA